MPLNSIVTIVLRLFSLHWLIQGIVLLPQVIQATRDSWPYSPSFIMFAQPTVLLVLAIGLFWWSHLLGRIVTPRPVPEVQLGGLSVYDLYSFTFTFLGLYFALTSVAGTLNWLHYYLTLLKDTPAGNLERDYGFYSLTQPLITFLAGLACLLFAPRFARKLASLQRNADPVAPPPAKTSPE
jgi:hypothetical protein